MGEFIYTLLRGARSFWRATDILSTNEIERCLPELCAVAYAGGKVIAVSTVVIVFMSTVRCRVANYRCAVSQEYRRRNLAWTLAGYSRDLLEKWSLQNPTEKVMALAAVLEADEFKMAESRHCPKLSVHGLNFDLIGYTPEGHQLRVSWFHHAVVE